MNPALMEKALDLIGDGNTFPLLYNDDVLVESVQQAWASRWRPPSSTCRSRCGEIVIDHQGFGTPSGALNVLKALEITLHDGIDPITGMRLGPATGEFASFTTFEDFICAYQVQLSNYIEILAEHEVLAYRVSAEHAPFLLLSLLYDDLPGAARPSSMAASATWAARWKLTATSTPPTA